MRKVSEILKLSLDNYSITTDRFMCCVIDDNYTREGSQRLNFTRVERKEAKDLIRQKIKNHSTLDSYLNVVSDDYSKIVDVNRAAGGKGYNSTDAFEIRLRFWNQLIAELEQRGK